MNTKKIILGIAAAAIITALVVNSEKKRKKKASKRLIEIADEGYETAHDILFPRKNKEFSKLKYGPVLPN